MHLTPNLNGTGREQLVEHRLDIMAACRALRDAMRSGWPNGRDYLPYGKGKLEADCEEWKAVERAVRGFEDKLETEAIAIQDGK